MKINVKKPYLCISYSVQDRDKIKPYLDLLSNMHYNTVCTSADTALTKHNYILVSKCEVFLTFISEASLKDERCSEEIDIAKKHKKTAIGAFLQPDLDIPETIKLNINRFQNIFLYRHADTLSLKDEIERSESLRLCTTEYRNKRRRKIFLRIFVCSLIAAVTAAACVFGIINKKREAEQKQKEEEWMATDGLVYNFIEGEDGSLKSEIIGYYGTSADVTVPPTDYRGLTVVSIAGGAFKGTGIISIKLPDTVLSISDYAFWGCAKLTEIELSDSAVYTENGIPAVNADGQKINIIKRGTNSEG